MQLRLLDLQAEDPRARKVKTKIEIGQKMIRKINFVIRILVLINSKSKSNNLIFVIIDHLTKIMHYELVKVIVNAFAFVKVIINIMLQHHCFSNLIVSN